MEAEGRAGEEGALEKEAGRRRRVATRADVDQVGTHPDRRPRSYQCPLIRRCRALCNPSPPVFRRNLFIAPRPLRLCGFTSVCCVELGFRHPPWAL